MPLITAVCLALWGLGLILTLWGTWLTYKNFQSAPQAITRPSISILKPLKGIDHGLKDNLDSFFKILYPDFEILFCIADPADPARAVVEVLLEKYSWIEARLFIGEEILGMNPKVNTLSRAYREAKYDHILISDSNVRAYPGYLQDLAPSLGEKTGIATAIVAGTDPERLGGALEATYLNTFYARWMILAAWFGFPAVVGKCMYFRKTVLARLGGIATFARYIAEDYMAGQAMAQLGLQVRVMAAPVRQFIGEYSFKAYWQRHIRWGRIRKGQAPIAFLAEPLFFPIVSSLSGAIGFYLLFGVHFFSVMFLHLFICLTMDLILIAKLDEVRKNTIWIWILRELLAVPLWFHAITGNTVHWRGEKYTISFGGLVTKTGTT